MPADEAERKPLMIKLPRSGKASVKKGQDEEAQELKALGKARKKEMGMETESDTEEDSDDEEEHTIAIQLFAQGDPAATTQRERSPTLLGAQQTAIITTRTTLSEFMDLVAVKAVLELTNSRSEWAIALVISGRSTLYKNPTALDYKTHEGKVVYRNWLSSLKPSRTGTVQVTGVRKPPAAKHKTKAKGAQSEASEGDVKLDTATLKAFTSIIRDNTCGDRTCLQRSALHPACWPVAGANPPRHLLLTHSNAHTWAIAMVEKMPGVDSTRPPVVPPYVVRGNIHANHAEAKDDKENVPLPSSQSSDGGIEFLHAYKYIPGSSSKPKENKKQSKTEIKKEVFDDKDSNHASDKERSPSSSKPRYGPHMSIEVFAAKYDLSSKLLMKLLDWDINSPATASEMKQAHMTAAKLTMGETLALKAALTQWRQTQYEPRGEEEHIPERAEPNPERAEPKAKRPRPNPAASSEASTSTKKVGGS